MPRSHAAQIKLANQEILGNGDLRAVDEMFAADYVAHAGGKDFKGIAFIKQWLRQLRAAIPDLRVVEVSILLEKGDLVSWQRTLRGTHKADLKGIPPSGKKVTWRDMHVTRFQGGKIAEEWVVSELAGQLMLKLPPA